MPNTEDLPFDDEMQMLAASAYRAYQTQGDLNALEFCIQSFRIAMDITEDDSPKKVAAIVNLAASMHARYKAMGQPRDLEEAISLGQLADTITPDEST